MRKLSALFAILALVVSAFIATPANAAGTHKIKPQVGSNAATAWVALEDRPATLAKWAKQGAQISLVGHSKTATATFPMRSIPARQGGYYVFTVTSLPAVGSGKPVKLSAKQFKALERVLPACKYEDSLNCVWAADKRGNKKGKSFVNFQQITFYKK